MELIRVPCEMFFLSKDFHLCGGVAACPRRWK